MNKRELNKEYKQNLSIIELMIFGDDSIEGFYYDETKTDLVNKVCNFTDDLPYRYNDDNQRVQLSPMKIEKDVLIKYNETLNGFIVELQAVAVIKVEEVENELDTITVDKVKAILKSSDNELLHNVLTNNNANDLNSFDYKRLILKTCNSVKDSKEGTLGHNAYIVLSQAVNILLFDIPVKGADIEDIKNCEDFIFTECLNKRITYEQYYRFSSVLSVVRLAMFKENYEIKCMANCIDFKQFRGDLNV